MKDIDPFGVLKEIMGAQEAAYGISLDSVITHEKSNEYIFDILSKDDFKADSPLSSCDTESTKDGGECAVKSNELTYSDAGSKHAGQADASPIAEEHQETSNSTWSQSDMSDHTTWAGLPSLCDLQNTGLTYHRLEHVCDMLGVGITTFKKHLRHIGLPRWPYRHLTSMQRMRRSIEVRIIVCEAAFVLEMSSRAMLKIFVAFQVTTSMTKAEKLKALKEIEISEGVSASYMYIIRYRSFFNISMMHFRHGFACFMLLQLYYPTPAIKELRKHFVKNT